MPNPHHLLVLLTLITISVVACTTTTTPASSPAATPTALPSTPTATENASSLILPTQTEVESDTGQDDSTVLETNHMNIQIGDTSLTATLVENSSVAALKDILAKGPLSINMRDYGSMEKVGPLGVDLPGNDQQITTEAGDIILFQGNALVIYYAPNSWNFTRLGKIENITPEKLKEILGDGNVTITLSLPDE